MLIEYIERMRKEPPAVRRRAVVFWTIILVGAIAFLYMVNLMLRGTMLLPKRVSDRPATTIAAPYEAAQ